MESQGENLPRLPATATVTCTQQSLAAVQTFSKNGLSEEKLISVFNECYTDSYKRISLEFDKRWKERRAGSKSRGSSVASSNTILDSVASHNNVTATRLASNAVGDSTTKEQVIDGGHRSDPAPPVPQNRFKTRLLGSMPAIASGLAANLHSDNNHSHTPTKHEMNSSCCSTPTSTPLLPHSAATPARTPLTMVSNNNQCLSAVKTSTPTPPTPPPPPPPQLEGEPMSTTPTPLIDPAFFAAATKTKTPAANITNPFYHDSDNCHSAHVPSNSPFSHVEFEKEVAAKDATRHYYNNTSSPYGSTAGGDPWLEGVQNEEVDQEEDDDDGQDPHLPLYDGALVSGRGLVY